MLNNREYISKEESVKRIKQLQVIIGTELRVSDSRVLQIIRQNPDLLWVDMNEFQTLLSILRSKYYFDMPTLEKLCVNLNGNEFKLAEFSKVELFLKNNYGLSSMQMNYAFKLNPKLISIGEDELKQYIEVLQDGLEFEYYFIRNLMTKSNSFYKDSPQAARIQFSYKAKYLYEFGITQDQLERNPSLLSNQLSGIDLRLKLALLNGCSLEDFVSSLFMWNERKVYARYMAIQNGMIPLETTYLSEREFNAKTGFETEDLMNKFPLNAKAIKKINELFIEKFPKQGPELEVKYREISTELRDKINQIERERNKNVSVELVKEEQEIVKPVEPDDLNKENSVKVETSEETNETIGDSAEIKRAKRLLGVDEFGLQVLMAGLKLPTLKANMVNRLAINLDQLEKMGFSKAECIAHPQALLVPSDKLAVRVKLAKINGRTNMQFLTNDYRCSEQTIYPRTCGVFIMKKTNNCYVYSTEEKFSKNFGSTTKELARFCDINNGGENIIQNLYEKALKELQEEK